mmetsp:Transcript_8544/g.9979  ORF Transcript_8544/g.9979 Transcript_8544/m.9979 type:complete len:190 (-) Transcript_8544:163-732(-)
MKSDIDESTMNHVTFCNENFKRDSPELLVKIQRSTNGTNAPTVQEQQRQINSLEAEVVSYKGEVQQCNDRLELLERRFSSSETHLNLGQPNAPVIASSAAIDAEERFSYSEKPLNLDRPNARVKASSAALDVEEIGRQLSMTSIDSFPLSLAPMACMASYEQPSNSDRVSLTSTKVAYDPPNISRHRVE